MAYICAPQNVLQTDALYALNQFFKGKAKLNDVFDTAQGEPIADIKDIEDVINNNVILNIKANEIEVNPRILRHRMQQLANKLKRLK